VWLDGAVNWAELADLLRDSYRLVAPKRLGATLEEAEGRPEKTAPADAGA
jgi:predicted DNA-binding protein (MmcQ/YjbR family)